MLYDLENLAVRTRQRAELQVAEIQVLSFGSDQDGEHQRGQHVRCLGDGARLKWFSGNGEDRRMLRLDLAGGS